MWQFVTVEADKSAGAPNERMLKKLRHALTHRRYEFDVYHCRTVDGAQVSQNQSRKWVTLDELLAYPLPRPHVRISQMLASR
jgi:adenine-specific DNA glycosylase